MRARIVLALLTAALTGCPAPPSPSPPPAGEQGEPDHVSPEAEPAETEAPTAGPVPGPTVPSTPPASPDDEVAADAPDWEELEVLEVLALGREVSVGFRSVEELATSAGRQPVARFVVSSGQVSYLCDVPLGGRLRAGVAELELSELSQRRARLRWLTRPSGPLSNLVEPIRAGDILELRSMGLYRLPDGTRLGVGNVLTLVKQSGERARTVSITVYPPSFSGQPGQPYDIFPRLVSGRKVRGRAGLGVRVRRLARGKIEIQVKR